MGDDSTQRAAYRFFVEHLQSLEPFTKEDLQNATGWSEGALETYWSKQFKGFLENVSGDKWRLRENFRRFIPFKKFRSLVTQVKTVPPTYAPVVFDDVVIYEFYMPLAHENALRVTLDSLFYKDAILPRLGRIGVAELAKRFPRGTILLDDQYLEQVVCRFVGSKFSGYSIYHVDGRFRNGGLLSQDQAAAMQKAGQRYLIDETTAVTRFVFPCSGDEPEKVRFLFERLFLNAITEQVSGEDEIWVVESGLRNRVSIWKPGD